MTKTAPSSVLDKTLVAIFNETIPAELRQKLDWDRRLRIAGTAASFGSANGTFSDVLSVMGHRKLGEMSMDSGLFAYGGLMSDKRSPAEALKPFVVPMTEMMLSCLEKTPLENQHVQDLVNFMDCFNRARFSGQFGKEEVAEIDKVMKVMANNFSQKIKA